MRRRIVSLVSHSLWAGLSVTLKFFTKSIEIRKIGRDRMGFILAQRSEPPRLPPPGILAARRRHMFGIGV
jgi:hypothetical protein